MVGKRTALDCYEIMSVCPDPSALGWTHAPVFATVTSTVSAPSQSLSSTRTTADVALQHVLMHPSDLEQAASIPLPVSPHPNGLASPASAEHPTVESVLRDPVNENEARAREIEDEVEEESRDEEASEHAQTGTNGTSHSTVLQQQSTAPPEQPVEQPIQDLPPEPPRLQLLTAPNASNQISRTSSCHPSTTRI